MSTSQIPAPENKLETSVEMGTLCAFYGGLLTGKQLEAVTLYYQEDLSLGEIAEQLGCTRQSVHELIVRSGEKLRAYEAAVGAAARMRGVAEQLEKAAALLEGVCAQALPQQARADVEQALGLIRETIEQEENDHGI